MATTDGSGSVRKSVIVTGGTYGIGRSITLELARRGWAVLAFGLEARQPGSAAENGVAGTRAALEAAGGLKAELLDADVSKSADVRRVVAHAIKTFGRLDAVVNNAAIRPAGTVLDIDEATFDRAIAVNLKGMFLVAREAMAHLKAAGGGSIVNIGSGAGWGKPGIAAYVASKGGVHAFTQALAYDHAADGIRANVVIPGPGTPSGMVEAMGDMSKRRVGGATGEDVAKAVAFLLSDDARRISGTVIDVGAFFHQGGPSGR